MRGERTLNEVSNCGKCSDFLSSPFTPECRHNWCGMWRGCFTQCSNDPIIHFNSIFEHDNNMTMHPSSLQGCIKMHIILIDMLNFKACMDEWVQFWWIVLICQDHSALLHHRPVLSNTYVGPDPLHMRLPLENSPKIFLKNWKCVMSHLYDFTRLSKWQW